MMMASSSPLALALALARLSHPLLFIRWLFSSLGKLVGNPFFMMEEAELPLLGSRRSIEIKL
jgi:hypothetical protein